MSRRLTSGVGIAIASAAGAACINLLLWPDFGSRYPLIGFYPAIAITAWFGGVVPGLVCTALSSMISAYVWLDPQFSIVIARRADAVALFVFIAIGGVISVLSEMSQRQMRHERSARQDAETSNRLKDQFLFTLSHELRTPLNAVLGWTDLLKSGTLPEEKRQRAIEAIHTNAGRQLTLIEDLLDVSRITAGTLRVHPVDSELLEIIHKAVDVIEPAAALKGIQVTVHGSPAVLRVDPGRLQQVFWNLLSNAIKFTPRGGTVTVDVRRGSSDVAVVVRDTGMGISAGLLPRVFEPFRQGKSTAESAPPVGVGLGLSIVKALVEAHGGSVHAMSAGAGRGSAFTVRLPVTTVVTEDAVVPSLLEGDAHETMQTEMSSAEPHR